MRMRDPFAGPVCWWTPTAALPNALEPLGVPRAPRADRSSGAGAPTLLQRLTASPRPGLFVDVKGLSHHLWGQQFCQLCWPASAWEFWKGSEAMGPGMIWGWRERKPASALVTEWVTCSSHSTRCPPTAQFAGAVWLCDFVATGGNLEAAADRLCHHP